MSSTYFVAMHSFWPVLLSISFASALTLQNSSALSNTLSSLANTTNSSILSTNRELQWECHPLHPTQGYGFEWACLDALHHMKFVPGLARQQYSWGPRGPGRSYDVYLPQRVYGSTGRCFVGVEVASEHPASSTARASQLQVEGGALAIMRECVDKKPPQGGTAKYFNEDGNIEVSINLPESPYNPPDMLCYGAMPWSVEASCNDLMNHLSVTSPSFRIGPSSDPDAFIHTPLEITSQDRRCALTATTTGPTDSISWETIWDIGVKLTGACARSGKQGRQINLGQDNHVIVQLTNPRAEVSSS